ncbi:MAG: hypothetical protein ABEJ57_07525 [Halobacteriaceae archaeon]
MSPLEDTAPAYWIAAGTLAGYLVFLAVLTVVLFLVPYLVFLVL